MNLPLADHRKTWEGSAAMLATALVTGFVAMLLTTPLSWPMCLFYAAVAAPVAAYVELISHGGNDTVTVASAVAVVLGLISLM